MPDLPRSTPTQSDWVPRHPEIPPPGPEPSRGASQGEVEQRLARLEAALSHTAEPWWRNAKTVTVLASIIAALVPLSTAIEGYLKGQADLDLAAQQQAHAMRMDYLRTALDPSAPEMQRQSRLRLLVSILDSGDPLRRWAEQELTQVNQNVKALASEVQQTRAKLDTVASAERAAQAKVEAIRSTTPPTSAPDEASATEPTPPPAATPTDRHSRLELKQATEELARARQLKAQLEQELDVKARKLTGKLPSE